MLSACEFPESQNTTESTPTEVQTQTESKTSTPDVIEAHFQNQTFNLTVADSPQERETGLMNQSSLKTDEGMLFIFDQPGNYGFWMKNTLIPLDIIWLSKNQQVMHYIQAQPCTTEHCTVFRPGDGAQALYVVELNAGTFTGKIGDYINF